MLTNVGVGPAIIQGFEVWCNSEPVKGPWEDQIATLGESLKEDGTTCEYYYPYKNDAIGVGERIVLLEYELLFAYDEQIAERVRDKLCDTKLIIYYQSVHDEDFVLDGPKERRTIPSPMTHLN